MGERWLESGEKEARIGDVVVHQDIDRTWRALLVVEGGFTVEIRPDAEDGSEWYGFDRFVSFRREVVRIASLDACRAGGRKVERQRGIAEERLRRRCAEEGADYGVCEVADPDGAAPTPELAAQYNRGWSRIRGRVGALRAAEAALEAVDAALEAAEPAARLATLEAREAGLVAELEAVRDEMAVLTRGGPEAGEGVDVVASGRPAGPGDPGAVLRVRVPRSLLARLDERAAAVGVSRGVLIRGALGALGDVSLEAAPGRRDARAGTGGRPEPNQEAVPETTF